MTIRDRKTLKQTAGRRLAAASYKPRRLILIHSGITLAAVLLMAVIQYVITWQIDANGGGLTGLPLRSVLDTARTVVSIAYGILMPFWSVGIFYAGLRLARGKAAYPRVLLEGFRRRGPVLRLILMQALIYGIISVVTMYGAWIIYGMTPDGQAFANALMKLITTETFTDYYQLIEAIPTEVIEQVTWGYLPVFGVVWLLLIAPAAYRMRLAPYVLMDKDRTGAWKAIRTSGKLTRRNCGHLLLLDLSYWWYYLLPVVLLLPAYANVLLPLVGLSLPVDPAVLYLGGQVIYVVLTLIFECFAKPKVQTTYALAYDVLLENYYRENPQAAPVQNGESEASYGV